MEKRKTVIKLLALFSFFFASNIHSQIDEYYQLNTLGSDEFNGSTINPKWQPLNLWNNPPLGGNWGGNSRFQASNTTISSGNIIFRTDSPIQNATLPYSFEECCNTGGLQSQGYNYNYGYIEIRAKLPGFVDANGIGHGTRFWPTLWLYYDLYVSNCLTIQDEIDILDPGGFTYSDAQTIGGNIHNENNNCGLTSLGSYQLKAQNPVCLDFHKYAMKWDTTGIQFFFDDALVFEKFHNPGFTMQPLRLVMGTQMDKMGDQIIPFDNGITFPQYMHVDYVRYYKLRLDCQTNSFINNNNDLLNFFYLPKVKKNIYIGNNSNEVVISNDANRHFRTTEGVTIFNSFTVPIGSEIEIIPTGCF